MPKIDTMTNNTTPVAPRTRGQLITDAGSHGLAVLIAPVPGSSVPRYRFFSTPTETFFADDYIYEARGSREAYIWLDGYAVGRAKGGN